MGDISAMNEIGVMPMRRFAKKPLSEEEGLYWDVAEDVRALADRYPDRGGIRTILLLQAGEFVRKAAELRRATPMKPEQEKSDG